MSAIMAHASVKGMHVPLKCESALHWPHGVCVMLRVVCRDESLNLTIPGNFYSYQTGAGAIICKCSLLLLLLLLRNFLIRNREFIHNNWWEVYLLRVSFPRFTHIIVSRKGLVNFAVMISIELGVLRSNVSKLFGK